ncbi:hypothetical protein AAMO2058_001231500 [Amorphochlora amoebiformis]|mmetsp:Transcript_9607/g.15209  ORF Transcript_9607/g.15209 Transcript_9607/m.15209 type:complete len:140 (-) Transcript_9607:3-422(-)
MADRKLFSCDKQLKPILQWIDGYAEKGYRPVKKTILKERVQRMEDNYNAAVYTKGVHFPRIGAFCSGLLVMWALCLPFMAMLVLPERVDIFTGVIRIVMALPFAWFAYTTTDPILYITERLDIFWKKTWRLLRSRRFED